LESLVVLFSEVKLVELCDLLKELFLHGCFRFSFFVIIEIILTKFCDLVYNHFFNVLFDIILVSFQQVKYIHFRLHFRSSFNSLLSKFFNNAVSLNNFVKLVLFLLHSFGPLG
jgi:hypothetical protein